MRPRVSNATLDPRASTIPARSTRTRARCYSVDGGARERWRRSAMQSGMVTPPSYSGMGSLGGCLEADALTWGSVALAHRVAMASSRCLLHVCLRPQNAWTDYAYTHPRICARCRRQIDCHSPLAVHGSAGVLGKRRRARCVRPSEGTLEEVLTDLLRECDVTLDHVDVELRVARRLLSRGAAA